MQECHVLFIHKYKMYACGRFVGKQLSESLQKQMCKSCIYIVLPAKSDSDVMFCLQIYHGYIIDRSLVY